MGRHRVPAHSAARAADETLPLREAIARLPVALEDRTGYDRVREFGADWIDADRDGCNTRMEVAARRSGGAVGEDRTVHRVQGPLVLLVRRHLDRRPRGLDIDQNCRDGRRARSPSARQPTVDVGGRGRGGR
ncbi:hypothetical protein [Streptomyces violarus]|uniref:hypothetical protein n=1 Tax=Streptomyces violarus TaxID=67380 RepID=UPI0021BF593A|nr:hypothetical protein [Streptomyces violarus]MCT9138569.1 hypothetical protein [Streptomyces violarus]